MSNAYSSGNSSELDHLIRLCGRLSDGDLARPVGKAGWTAAGLLAHLAFWDLRALTLIEKWKHGGIGPSPVDTDVVNEATRLPFLSIPVRSAAELAFESAKKICQEIDRLDPAMLRDIEEKATTFRLSRADHYRHHLSQIEKELGL
jgi:hypothetical protein